MLNLDQTLVAEIAACDAASAAAQPSAFVPSTTIHPVQDQIRSGLPGHGVVTPVEHVNAVRAKADELKQQGVTRFMLTEDAPDRRFTRLEYEGQPTALYVMVHGNTAIFAVSAADLRAAQRPGRRAQQKPGDNRYAVA